MKILALELSTVRGSLAWLDDGLGLVREWANDRKNSGPFFENLKSVSEKFGSPDKIIIGLGPGSYAGIRIAISAAVGLQAASKAELVGLPSICALDCETKDYCVIGDARRQSFFFADVRAGDLRDGPELFSEDELRDKLNALGPEMPIFASEKLSQFERVGISYPSATLLARMAQEPDRHFELPPLEPIYLREPHITPAKPMTAKS
jgi:tRNA threonylcarbamoyladenosine biosynthesis protein TsaB